MIIQVITLLKDKILSHANILPYEFLNRTMNLLKRGSIHSTISVVFQGANIINSSNSILIFY